MTKQEQVDKIWATFENYKKTAEQHEFPTLLTIDIMFGPAYKDLQKNWSDEHADLFMKGMNMIFERFKIKIENE